MTDSSRLIHFLSEFDSFTESDKELIHKNIELKQYSIGSTFIEAGKVAHQVGFILNGVFRYFFYDREGNEITSYFMKEDEFVTSMNSFFEYGFSSGAIVAETDCEALIISRNSWELFAKEIPNWNRCIQNITNKVLIGKTQFQRQLIHQDAKSAYLEFVNQQPTIVQRVALNHIASFLGITKFSLSRIRKQIAEE